MDLLVDDLKFEELVKACSVMELSENKPVKATVLLKNTEYVVTGMAGTGTGIGWAEVYANRVVDLIKYRGKLTPLSYLEYRTEVNAGRRERGYEGLLVQYGTRKLVMCEQVVFKKSKERSVQTSLF